MNIWEELRQESRPIVIFGAGVTGEIVLQLCRENDVSIAAFCDNNREKTGRELNGVKVIYAPSAPAQYPGALFIITVIDIRDVARQLAELGCRSIMPASGLLRHCDVYRYRCSRPADFVEYVVSACIRAHDCFSHPEKLFIRSVDLVITERCSLRCRDCSNLMQYYTRPVDYPTEVLLKSVDSLCSLADEINEFRLIGGEPFMNRQWPRIAARLYSESRVNRVVFYTNGTICPEMEELKPLAVPETLFIVTDYGALSKNIDRLCSRLSELQIAFTRLPADGWTDCAGIGLRERSAAELQEVFDGCCVKNSYTVSNGRFYRCPFSANAVRLGAVPEIPEDSFDLLAPTPSREELLALVRRVEPINACRFCAGRRLDAPKIEPAVQLKKPRPLACKFSGEWL